jgi:hypothetical protein
MQIPPANVQPVGPAAPDDYNLIIPALPAAGDRALNTQTWQVVVQIPGRNGVRSQPLAFRVLPRPTYRLTLTPPAQAFQYGDQAVYTVELVRSGNFQESVDITMPGPPVPASWNWNFFDDRQAVSRTIDGASANLRRTLRGPVTSRLFSPGSNPITVSGQSHTTGQPASAQATLTVNREVGEFSNEYRHPWGPGDTQVDVADPDDPDARVHVDYHSYQINDFRVTFARTDLPGTPTTSPEPAIYYLISPHHYRIGLVLHDVCSAQTVKLYNLGFTGSPGWNINTARQFPGNLQRQQYWFSSDDSLLLVVRLIEQTPDNQLPSNLPPGTQPGEIWTYGASLYDAVTAAAIGSEQVFKSRHLGTDVLDQSARRMGGVFNTKFQDFPDPNVAPYQPPADSNQPPDQPPADSNQPPDQPPEQPGPPCIGVLADIYKVELLRDHNTRELRVEGTYRLVNGAPGVEPSFEVEIGRHPDRFGKFQLPIP